MRRGIEERGPIAAWLITSRAQFREPGAKRSWTVEQFLATLQEEVGWAPTRTTYARWESGAARPDPENLRRVEEFYAARGIEPHDVPVASPVASDTQAGLAALIDTLIAEQKQTQTILAAVLERLAPPASQAWLEPEEGESFEEWTERRRAILLQPPRSSRPHPVPR